MINPDKARSPDFPQPKEINIIDYKPLTLEEKIAQKVIDVLHNLIPQSNVYIVGGYPRDLIIANKDSFSQLSGNRVNVENPPLFRDIDLFITAPDVELQEFLDKIPENNDPKTIDDEKCDFEIEGIKYKCKFKKIVVRGKNVIIIEVGDEGRKIGNFELTYIKYNKKFDEINFLRRWTISRSDFTCNALYLKFTEEDERSGGRKIKIIDPLGEAIKHILSREIIPISNKGEDRKVEDEFKNKIIRNPFLILRYIRLIVDKGFRSDKRWQQVIIGALEGYRRKNNKSLFAKIGNKSLPRTFREILKIVFSTSEGTGYDILWEWGIMTELFPSFEKYKDEDKTMIRLKLTSKEDDHSNVYFIDIDYVEFLKFMSRLIRYLNSSFLDLLSNVRLLAENENLTKKDKKYRFHFLRKEFYNKYRELWFGWILFFSFWSTKVSKDTNQNKILSSIMKGSRFSARRLDFDFPRISSFFGRHFSNIKDIFLYCCNEDDIIKHLSKIGEDKILKIIFTHLVLVASCQEKNKIIELESKFRLIVEQVYILESGYEEISKKIDRIINKWCTNYSSLVLREDLFKRLVKDVLMLYIRENKVLDIADILDKYIKSHDSKIYSLIDNMGPAIKNLDTLN